MAMAVSSSVGNSGKSWRSSNELKWAPLVAFSWPLRYACSSRQSPTRKPNSLSHQSVGPSRQPEIKRGASALGRNNYPKRKRDGFEKRLPNKMALDSTQPPPKPDCVGHGVNNASTMIQQHVEYDPCEPLPAMHPSSWHAHTARHCLCLKSHGDSQNKP